MNLRVGGGKIEEMHVRLFSEHGAHQMWLTRQTETRWLFRTASDYHLPPGMEQQENGGSIRYELPVSLHVNVFRPESTIVWDYREAVTGDLERASALYAKALAAVQTHVRDGGELVCQH
ncbi:MAG TPA: hypothetical protein VG841_07135 [Caulobacterales bacterium]|nr:hypothetical protein [Caulobacterales bacterium]